MSFNQSRSDRNDAQYRKSGRSASSNQQRSSSGGYGKGAGAGPAPSPTITSSSSSSVISNRSSFKKSNNAQGGQSRVSLPAVNSSESSNASTPRNVQNGAHVPPQLHGGADAPVASGASKQTEVSTPQRTTRTLPKAPTSQSASMTSEITGPTTPAKAPVDASKAFPFQFGSISPGFMNGMQIPARTSSAPPNLDEQRRDQARHDSLGPLPNLPIPEPKQQMPRKDAEQPNAGEAHQATKAKRDFQVSPASPASQTQKPSVIPPMTGMKIHPPKPSFKFGGPNPPIQSQSMTATSIPIPIPIPIPMGNAPPVQQQVFVPGLQSHQLPPQGIMHQGQGLSFTTPMGPQLPPQIGHMGLNMSPQYPQQQGGKFGGPRKIIVKITHPDTHEELRLDKRTDNYLEGGASGPRSHPNMPSQSQPIPSFPPPHSINYYPNSYNTGSMFFPPSSLPLTSNQMAPSSQGPRFNYPVAQGSQNVPFVSPAAHTSAPVNKFAAPVHSALESSNFELARDSHTVSSAALSGAMLVTIKPAVASVGEKIAESFSGGSPAGEKVASPRPLALSGEGSSLFPQRDQEPRPESSSQQLKPSNESLLSKSSPGETKQVMVSSAAVSSESLASNSSSWASAAPSEETVAAVTNAEERKKEGLSRSNSMKDHQKKAGKKGYVQHQHQVGGQSTVQSVMTSEHGTSFSSGTSETADTKLMLAPPLANEGLSESLKQPLSTVDASTSDLKAGFVVEGISNVSSGISGSGVSVDTVITIHHEKLDDSSMQGEQPKQESPGIEEQGEKRSSQKPVEDNNNFEISLKSLVLGNQTEQESILNETSSKNELPTTGLVHGIHVDAQTSCLEGERISDSLDVSTSQDDKTSTFSASSSRSDSKDSNELAVTNFGLADQHSVRTPDIPEATLKFDGEGEGVGNGGSSLVSAPASGSKDKPILEQYRPKSNVPKKKKKRREILQKADAAGTTSDLYMAYKGPEDKKEALLASESIESVSAGVNLKQALIDDLQENAVESEEISQSKPEPDDWEDAADISTNLETSEAEPADGGLLQNDKVTNGHMAKKYSRDFLLKFAEQCTDLPEGFDLTSEVAEALVSASVNGSHLVDRDSYPSPGRVVDRPGSGSRVDRRASGIVDDDRWSKLPGYFGPGRDIRLDIGYGGNMGFRPGQGGNYGVLRNPRTPGHVQYVGGILSGPVQSMGPQGGTGRTSPDAERWQRATSFQQKGLIPSPQTPSQMMHKAEKKYEVGKVTDEEQTKQRQLKAILNKLTPQNFDKLFEQVKAVNIDNTVTLTGVISQIFDKALMEPTFCEMYANFCYHLAAVLPDFSEENEKITFKRLLLNKCQEEFERGEREQEEANKVEEEGEVKQSEEEREEKRIKARRRMLGNIRLIGELYKKKMLTERIMHSCINKLLGQYQNPDEEDIEALCKLMSTIGEIIDHPLAKEHMDAYFDRMTKLSNNMKLSSRVRFMLKDAIDLRKNKWQQRRKVEGPKKIEEVHRDAAQERQTQASRLTRGPGINPSARRAPMEFSPRGSTMLPSQNSQVGSFRGLPPHARGYGTQDARFDERPFEARTLSVPLPQRPLGDDSITLGPQGGLGRGMSSIRGPLPMPGTRLADISSSPGDSRRMAAGLNGFGPVPERTTFASREDLTSRFVPDRFSGPAAYEQPSAQERGMNYGNREKRNPDRVFDRPQVTSPHSRGQGLSVQNVPSEKVWPEERLRDMSMAAIKEFYSARDEKEVALCIKDLNSPGFHPTMISLWVTDSFERKDMERAVLTDLLVNLAKSRDGILNQAQLLQGFESVLTTLEDAVNDAPKAAEFLGRIFAKVIVENVVPLREIARLIHEGGEEPGSLLEIGLAGDVLGSTLEIIKSEKGESVLNDIRRSSNLRLEDFRPPDPNRSRILEKFI